MILSGRKQLFFGFENFIHRDKCGCLSINHPSDDGSYIMNSLDK